MSSRLASMNQHLTCNRIIKMREKHPLSRSNLLNAIYGEKYAKIRDLCFDVMMNNPDVFKHSDTEDFTFEEERKAAAQMTLLFHKLRPLEDKEYMKDLHEISMTAHATYNFDPGFSVKCDITFFLYTKTLYSFASQNPIQQEFVRRAISFEDIGCFGLTELGHGSNVRGILTEAIYDEDKQQFIINSPCKDAMKFWIGAAAQLATMSVIWAQLIIKGEKYGPHPFIVPIRDKKTHEPFKGVRIGDCGHKVGNNIIDNGHLMFDNYRIPKSYALDRISGIDKNNKFFAALEDPQKRFGMYMGPLSVGRGFVATNSVTAVTSGLAIAIRYANVRKQFVKDNEKQEELLINYPLTKHRLMPLVAQNLVYYFGGAHLLYTYNQNLSQLLNPKSNIVNELHAQTGPCKAKSSWFTNKAMTQCREMLGGHGYSSYSGLSRIFHGQDINTTWEGDNNMLYQQTTKYILKAAKKLSKGKTFENNFLQFLTENIEIPENPQRKDFQSIEFLGNILKNRVQIFTQECAAAMMEMSQSQQMSDPMDIWNQTQTHFGNTLASSFGDYYYFDVFKKKTNEMKDKDWKEIMENCTKLWIYELLREQKWGTYKIRQLLSEMIVELCQWLEPRSVSILDCLAAPSQIIGSPFSDENGEGFKKYLNLVMSGNNTFKRVDWYQKIIKKRGD